MCVCVSVVLCLCRDYLGITPPPSVLTFIILFFVNINNIVIPQVRIETLNNAVAIVQRVRKGELRSGRRTVERGNPVRSDQSQGKCNLNTNRTQKSPDDAYNGISRDAQ